VRFLRVTDQMVRVCPHSHSTRQSHTQARPASKRRKTNAVAAVVAKQAGMRSLYWTDLDFLVQEFTAIRQQLLQEQEVR
jgi:hypothetical protein